MSFVGGGAFSNIIRTGFERGYAKINRGAVTPKTAPRGWYKGRGARSLGHHTKHGSFVLEARKIPAYVVPNLEGCELKPYVAKNTPPPKKRPPHKAPTVPEMLAFYGVENVRQLAVKAMIAQQPLRIPNQVEELRKLSDQFEQLELDEQQQASAATSNTETTSTSDSSTETTQTNTAEKL
eukprot:TRINITY_DN9342_c0_g1_i1.p1 TRINITY_DN9342_c0_g1~~TRINITY_DN9342_c0_g1_i1.p1  ORF type:complete len:180 (-),score=37.86 TRINITY_DN9342_c0_g1_i1:43-582(-)